jgi:hypothetical protein
MMPSSKRCGYVQCLISAAALTTPCARRFTLVELTTLHRLVPWISFAVNFGVAAPRGIHSAKAESIGGGDKIRPSEA